MHRQHGFILLACLFLTSLPNRARFFLAWRVYARQAARGAAFFILTPAAMVLNANFGLAERRRDRWRTLTIGRFYRARTARRVDVLRKNSRRRTDGQSDRMIRGLHEHIYIYEPHCNYERRTRERHDNDDRI